MVPNIETLNCPPKIGRTYLVPCVFGRIDLLGRYQTKPPEWWPVMRPSHQDSQYLPKTRTIWRDGEEIEEVYYETDSYHHFHIDPRFAPAELYTSWEVENEDWHNIIDIQSDVEWREMECLRPMPVQRLFTGFGEQFVKDHVGKQIKCGRCPHRGVLLNSVPTIDGVITCPNHGLRFDAKSKCIQSSTTNSPETETGTISTHSVNLLLKKGLPLFSTLTAIVMCGLRFMLRTEGSPKTELSDSEQRTPKAATLLSKANESTTKSID